MVPLTPEDYYLVAVYLGGGLIYLGIGGVIMARPPRWLNLSFLLMPKTRKRVAETELTTTSSALIRCLGTCFSLIAILTIKEGTLHALCIARY
jgi:hypothetical protein